MCPEKHVQKSRSDTEFGIADEAHPFSFNPRKALEVKIDVYFVIYCPIL